MKKRISAIFFALIMAISVFSALVSADMGPKDSVNVSFKNMGVEECYCTLLSSTNSTGPHNSGESHANDDDIDKIFNSYKDPDGFYYLHYFSRVDDSKEFSWGYYPPTEFKILLYYPATETFTVSGIYDEYAFTSFYTVDMKDIRVGVDNQILTVKKTYSPFYVILAFIARVLITLAIEVAIALLFGFKQKKQLVTIIIVNVITQLLLNLIFYKIMADLGPWFLFFYIPLELLIFIVEAVAYCIALRGTGTKVIKTADCVLYAFLGNFASFIGGIAIGIIFPWVAM